jgi:Domain of unknown function (DUF3391)
MIKKISVEKLRLGMFICGTDRKWIDLPFIRAKFKVTSEKDIATLQSYCQEVLIDTEKGCDEELIEEEVLVLKPTNELTDTFDFDTDFNVVELSSGELGLLKNSNMNSGLHIMTDAYKDLLPSASFITLEKLEANNLKISKQLAHQDPLCKLLMAVYARSSAAE